MLTLHLCGRSYNASPLALFPAQYANSRNECEALAGCWRDPSKMIVIFDGSPQRKWICITSSQAHKTAHSPTRWQQSIKVKDKRSFLSVMVPFSCLRLLGVSSLSIRKSCERKQQHALNKVINKPVDLFAKLFLSVPLPSPIWWQDGWFLLHFQKCEHLWSA